MKWLADDVVPDVDDDGVVAGVCGGGVVGVGVVGVAGVVVVVVVTGVVNIAHDIAYEWHVVCF